MNDRELLEMAAKATGVSIWFDDQGRKWTERLGRSWNPLTDDGDALRLAVDLNIGFRNMGHIMTAAGSGGQFNEYADGDAYAATRRAIVRAAAEIQRGKERK